LGAIEHERRLVVAPRLLRLLVFQSRFFPRLTERVLFATGKRRGNARA